jgi:membrane protease YdiL (CAAX protease family)
MEETRDTPPAEEEQATDPVSEPRPPAADFDSGHHFLLPGDEELAAAPRCDGWINRTLIFLFSLFGIWAASLFIGIMVRGPLIFFAASAVPIFVMALLPFFAYGAYRFPWLAPLAYFLLALTLVAICATTTPLWEPPEGAGNPFRTFGKPNLPAILVACLGLMIAIGCCVKPGKQALHKALGLNPDKHVHTIAVALVAASCVVMLGALLINGGSPSMLENVDQSDKAMSVLGPNTLLYLQFFVFVWTIPGTMVAVGYPIERSARDAWHRLGMRLPTVRQCFGAIGMAVLLVIVMNFGVEPLTAALWKAAGWPRTDVAAFEKMLAPAFSLTGAILIGVTAGIGEELLVRGVLQPRLGIFLSNLFFTSLHAAQYGFDALISVFTVGLILGLVRKRTNTATSAIVHGTYDFILIMLQTLFPSGAH